MFLSISISQIDSRDMGSRQLSMAISQTRSDAMRRDIVGLSFSSLVTGRYDTISHASNHALEGRDPISPKMIGAAEEAHEHSTSDIEGLMKLLEDLGNNGQACDFNKAFKIVTTDDGTVILTTDLPMIVSQWLTVGSARDIPESLPGGNDTINHASNHALEGCDPISPKMIGAAKEVHEHSTSDIEGLMKLLEDLGNNIQPPSVESCDFNKAFKIVTTDDGDSTLVAEYPMIVPQWLTVGSAGGLPEGNGDVKLLSFEEYEALEHKKNHTLYACLDEETQSITKAFVGKYPFVMGSGAPTSHIITVGINPADVAMVKNVTADGDVLKTEVSANRELYTFTVADGGAVTISIVCVSNHKVKQLNIDTVNKGASNSYKFEYVRTPHTAYVWAEIDIVVPVDFLQRSDKPGVVYSSTHVILKSIKADYPDGLTQDVTVECIKLANEPRLAQDSNKLNNEWIFMSVLENWNKNTLYTLTIDGKNKLTYSCTSLGGLRFTNVDNIIIRNIKFVNYCNYVEYYSPNEMAAVMFVGEDIDYCRNIIIEKCSFNGLSTKDGKTGATYTMSTKYTENVSVVDSTFMNNSGLTFRFSNARISSFTRNDISGNQIEGKVSHPGFFDISGGYRLIIEDNNINGSSFKENIMYLNNIDDIRISRNTFKKGARVAEFLANASIKRVVIESNLFDGLVDQPIYDWVKEHFSGPVMIEELIMNNNTFWLSGNYYQKFVVRMESVNKLFFYNNIVVDPRANVKAGILQFTTLAECNSGNNIYKVTIVSEANEQTESSILNVINPDSSPDSLTVIGSDIRSLKNLRNRGFEIDSKLVLKSLKLLNNETGGSDYAITPEYNTLLPGNNSKTPTLDNSYKKKSATANSRGYINLHGFAFDETLDVSDGYTGDDVSEAIPFSSHARYDTPADSALLLTHNTLDRGRLVKWMIQGTQHNELLMGKYALLHTKAELTANSEYLADELYTVTID